MIVDAGKIALGETIRCDVAIVGSGAAGITLGLKLAAQGLSVVIAEAGGMRGSEDSQQYFAGEVAGQRPVPLEIMRQRCLGGTTTVWGGRCIPFDPVDFEKRSWMAHSGWPIEYHELARFYPEALEWCHAGKPEFSAEVLDIPEMISDFRDGEVSTDCAERWSLPTNFGRDYRADLENSPNIQLLVNAPCVDIRLSKGQKHVEHLVLQGKDRTRVHANNFSLCCGGLEVPRMLLAANSQQERGIGNDHDVVGRYYMGHLCGIIAQAEFDSEHRIDTRYIRNDEGIYVRRRITICRESQHKNELPNSATLLHYPMIGNPEHGNGVLSLMFIAIYFFRKLRAQIPGSFLGLEQDRYSKNRLFMLHVANVLKDLPKVLIHFPGFAANRFFARRRIPSFVPQNNTGCYPIYYHVEQEANPESRVTLSSAVDPLGIPKLKSEFKTMNGDLERVMRVHEFLGDYFSATGVGRIEYLSAEPQQDVLAQFDMGDAHFIGTSRMGNDPADSVVDSECRVHGYNNLYIVSSSVFPSSGQANPTLTIVALALRTAGIITSRLQA